MATWITRLEESESGHLPFMCLQYKEGKDTWFYFWDWLQRQYSKVHQGHAGGDPGPCQLEDIRVSSVLTGRLVLNVPEHNVTVENLCSCPQSGVVMSCNLGEVKAVLFDTSKISLLNREEGLCLINSGWPIFNGKPITFTYAAKTPLDFTLDNASPECRA